ncbi:MAG: helix-turn-helix transcriptional regulator [Shinella sp.]|uniref:helix-turn-helix transcriptional regulator n=1 Tax=Shinella sp. TaxID=1870904 RepID=UPI0040366346
MKPEQILDKIQSIYAWAGEADTRSGLDILRDAVGAEHAVLARQDRTGVDTPLTCSRLASAEFDCLGTFWSRDFTTAPLRRMPVDGAFRITDIVPLQALTNSHSYQEVLRHIDGGLAAATKLAGAESSSTLFICRSARRGFDFSNQELVTINLLARHVVEANEIRLRLETGREREAQSYGILDLVDEAVVLLDHDGRIIFINREADVLFSTSAALSSVNGYVRATSHEHDLRLQSAIRNVVDPDVSGSSHAPYTGAPHRLSVPQERGLSLTVKILPGREIGGGPNRMTAAAVLLIKDPEKSGRIHAQEFSAQFGLSEREAQLAALICGGATLKDASAILGISVGTARQYLKSVFLKTGVARQSDLIRLIRN